MDVFFLRVLLSFIIGGIWVTFSILMAEKLGNKIGGIVLSLPSTALVSIFFIGWTESAEYAAKTAALEPYGLVSAVMLIFTIIALLKTKGNVSFLIAFVVWLIATIGIKMLDWKSMLGGILLYVIVCSTLYYITDKKLQVRSVKAPAKKHTIGELLLKAGISGGMVALTVIIAHSAGPWWGGVFAAFPAATVAGMYILNKEYGPDFAMATGKIVMPASSNIVVFLIAITLTYPVYGLVYGTIISYIAALVFALLFYLIMKRAG